MPFATLRCVPKESCNGNLMMKVTLKGREEWVGMGRLMSPSLPIKIIFDSGTMAYRKKKILRRHNLKIFVGVHNDF